MPKEYNLRDFLPSAVAGLSKYYWVVAVGFVLLNMALGAALAIFGDPHKRLAILAIHLIAVIVVLLVIVAVMIFIFTRGLRAAASSLSASEGKNEDLSARIASLSGQTGGSSPEALYQLVSELVGLARDDLTREAILHNDGHVIARWAMRLRAVSQHVGEIEHRYWCDGDVNKTGTKLIQSAVGDQILQLEEVSSIKKEKQYRIKIVPSILEGHALPVELETTSGPGAFVMRKTSMTEGDRFEYSSLRVTYPSNRLRLKFTYPRDYVPDEPSYDVWYGDSKVRHKAEYGRVSGRFSMQRDQAGAFYALLEVEFPIVGLTYALTWIPQK